MWRRRDAKTVHFPASPRPLDPKGTPASGSSRISNMRELIGLSNFLFKKLLFQHLPGNITSA